MRRKKYLNRIAAVVMSAAMACSGMIIPHREAASLFSITAYADSIQGKVNTDRLNVRSGPGTGNSIVATLSVNTQVSILGETRGSDGYIWYQISVNGKTGYARYDFITKQQTFAASDASFESWMNTQGFPESYKNGLRGLHQQYPNWVFKADRVGIDWNTAVAEESKIGRNLVDKNSISSWKSIADGAFDWAGNYWPGFDGDTWVQASPEIIAHYMDPRNFLTDPYVFQFELQTYDPSVQNKEGLKRLVEGTFLAGDAIVPIDGSKIEGGTPYYGSLPTGSSSSSSGNSTGTTSGSTGGPGGNSSSGNSGIGPGAGISNAGISSEGPGGSGQAVVVSAPQFISSIESALGMIESYANWAKRSDDQTKWVYYDDNGTLLTNGWFWLDGNHDGISECYYFYADGTMAADTTVEGYYVNADGKWCDGNGTIQTKGSAGNGQSAIYKSVPYVDIIMKAAELSNVSPYVLAAGILQEQGTKGTSALISGASGYYNFYNIGAYAHDGMTAVQAGIKYASESGNGNRPWNSIEKAVIGGASAYGASYVAVGQNTFYLKKFNVQGSNKYNHQFMTHTLAAAAEGAKVSSAYGDAFKKSALEFKIPVYENMPESPCTLPSGDGNPNNKLSGLSVDGFSLTPTFGMNTTEYSLIVPGSTAYVNINAQKIDSRASVSGAGQVALNVGSNNINIVVKAQNGSERIYHLVITRRDDGTQGQAMPVEVGTGDSQAVVPGTIIGPSAGPGAAAAVQTGQESAQPLGPGGAVIIGSTPQ